jgi:hypothetical protein
MVASDLKKEAPLADIVFGLLVAVPALALIATVVVEKRRRARSGKPAR